MTINLNVYARSVLLEENGIVKIKVYLIDFETPRWARRALAWGIPSVLIFGALGLGVAVAQTAPLHVWNSGDVLDAGDLNGNFQNLQSQIATLQTQVASLQAFQTHATADGGYSVGATYCGAATNGGQINGYTGAKALCQTTCSTASAHMCTSDELARSVQLGLNAPSGWYSTLTAAFLPNTDDVIDCEGWQSSSSSVFGALWNAQGSPAPYPSETSCNVTNQVLCCN